MPRETSRTAHPLRRLLALPAFRRLWLTGALANGMRWVEILVAAIFTFQATGSALAVSLVTLMRALPLFLLGAAAGALAEVLDRRRLLMAGQALLCATALVLCALALAGLLRPWHLGLAGFLGGLVWCGEMASRRRMLTEVAGEGDVVTAVAFDSLTSNSTRMAGPLLGGAIYQTLGPAAAFGLAACCYPAAFLLLAGVSNRQVPGRFATRALLADMGEAIALVRRMPVLLAVIMTTIALNIFGFCFTAVAPAFGVQQFGASPLGIGLLSAAEPAGALLTGLTLAARRGLPLRGGLLVAGGVLFLLCLILVAHMPALWLAIAMLMLGGAGTAVFAALQTALPVTMAPEGARSRVLGLVATCIGMSPIGVLAIGVLADAWGPPAAITIMATAGLMLMAWTVWLLARRR
jgi:MFS family permease